MAAGEVIFKGDDWAAREMARRAETFVNRGRRLCSDLDYSDESIEVADDLAARMWTLVEQDIPADTARERRSQVVFDLGAYVGETLIRNHGGRWGWAVLAERRVLALHTASGVTAFPFSKARKRLSGVEPGSLVVFYRFLCGSRPIARPR